MKQKNKKTLTIFLFIMIAVLFTSAIVLTLLKNHFAGQKDFYDKQNEIINEQLK